VKKDQEIDASFVISHLSKRTPKNGARTEKTWCLTWKTADPYQKSISFQKVTRGKTQLKYFGFRNVFGDFLFKRVAPEEG